MAYFKDKAKKKYVWFLWHAPKSRLGRSAFLFFTDAELGVIIIVKLF